MGTTHKEAALKRLGLTPGKEVVRDVHFQVDGDLADEAERLAGLVPVSMDVYMTRALQFYNRRVKVQLQKAEKLDHLASKKKPASKRAPSGAEGAPASQRPLPAASGKAGGRKPRK